MTKDTFFGLPDWRERCLAVCDTHGFGSFDQLDATRRAEVIAIAKNVAGAVEGESVVVPNRNRTGGRKGQ